MFRLEFLAPFYNYWLPFLCFNDALNFIHITLVNNNSSTCNTTGILPSPHFSAKHLPTINLHQRHVYVRTCLSSFFICLCVCCLVCALLYAVLALALSLSCCVAVACSLDRCVWVVWWLVLCRSVVPLWFKLFCCCVVVVVQHVLLLPSLPTTRRANVRRQPSACDDKTISGRSDGRK